MRKTTRKKIAPIVVTVLVILYVLPLAVMLIATAGMAGQEDARLTLPLLCYGFLGGAVIIGILLAIHQRLDEIDGGEEDEASKY